MGGMVAVVAASFAMVGVWWVLPFAGIEIVVLIWAFSRIAARDDDFERIEMSRENWSYSARRQGKEVSASGATCWLNLEEQRIRGRLVVGLRYAGQRFEVGSFLPEDQRAGLVRELTSVIRGSR